jgi:hypothetical protein
MSIRREIDESASMRAVGSDVVGSASPQLASLHFIWRLLVSLALIALAVAIS